MEKINQSGRFESPEQLPAIVKKSLGIGRFRAKVFKHPDGEIIAKATQGIGEVIIKVTFISSGDKAKSVELTERELHQLLLMAKDVRKATGQQDDDLDQAELEEG